MPRVPNALIRRLCYSTSYRLPKMEHMQYPPIPAEAEKKPYVPAHVPSRLVQPTGGHPHRQRELALDYEKGNLKNDEYRFFVGYPSTVSTHSTCRWCQGRFETDAARKAHKKAECKRKLTDLYAMLLKDHNCVMCDNHTVKEYWGIPLCTTTCQNEFRFTLSQTMKFETNRLLVKAGERMVQ
jgi:hypothetical protein